MDGGDTATRRHGDHRRVSGEWSEPLAQGVGTLRKDTPMSVADDGGSTSGPNGDTAASHMAAAAGGSGVPKPQMPKGPTVRTPRHVRLGRPEGGPRFDAFAALLSAAFVGGLFLDGWAHNHGKVDQSFFTPWHAILYSSYAI